MKDKQKAEIILYSLNRYIQIDMNFKEFYLKGILEGLKEIKEASTAATDETNK